MKSFHFDAVLFDLDGVLVDTARLHYAAWKRLADRIGVEFDEQRNEALKGVDRMRSLALLLGAHADEFSEVEKQRLAEEKNRGYVDALVSIGRKDLLPGALDVLTQVTADGLKTALVSASRNAPLIVEQLEIADYFDVIVDPASVRHGKPAPDLFLAAARDIHVLPAQCLGIEDAPAGIVALKAAGMLAVGVGSPSLLPGADWVVPDLSCFRVADFRRYA